MTSLSTVYKKEEDNMNILSLAHENLTEVPVSVMYRFGSSAETLDLSHNKISRVHFLVQFENLSTVVLDHNEIISDTVFPFMPKLRTLWLNHNMIDALYPFMDRLQESCPQLQYLSIMGNPAAPSYLNGGTFYEYLQYRLFVISRFPELAYLDDRPVTDDQRDEAKRLYCRPFIDTLLSLHLPSYLKNIQDKVKNWFEDWNSYPASCSPRRRNMIV